MSGLRQSRHFYITIIYVAHYSFVKNNPFFRHSGLSGIDSVKQEDSRRVRLQRTCGNDGAGAVCNKAKVKTLL